MTRTVFAGLVGSAFLVAACANPDLLPKNRGETFLTSPASPVKTIDAFRIEEPLADATIDEATHKVTVTLPAGTDLSSLKPRITFTGWSIVPFSGVPQDFTNSAATPVVYTVTAYDDTQQAYEVTVTAPGSVKEITTFSIPSPAAAGSVDPSTRKITVSVPAGTNLASLAPLITFQGASVSPASGTAADFSNSALVPVVYTVTAADGSTQTYQVTVTTPHGSDNSITGFSLPGLDTVYRTGTIHPNTRTIAFTVPFGTAVSNLTPVIVHTGSSVSPAPGVPQDFAAPVSYTVTAQDGTTSTYTVTVALETRITTAAGDGTLAALNGPAAVVKDGSGNLYIADRFNHRVRKIDPSGTASNFAGTGTAGFSGDHGPASAARLDQPAGLAIGDDGSIYIADRQNNRVRKVAADGTITTVAGNGSSDYSGDGGSPVSAGIWLPDAVAVDGAGTLYIATSNSHVVRKVSQGVITTLAGTGNTGYSGDGGPAAAATLYTPLAVAVDGAGNVLIADYHNFCVRQVSPDGTITTVAGTGSPGPQGLPDGDGGLATEAHLGNPTGLAFDRNGLLTIAQDTHPSVRRIAADGTISTIAGTGISGFSGDNGPATQANMKYLRGLFWDASGALYIADAGNNRIRSVTGTF